jgi:hypothetical protein
MFVHGKDLKLTNKMEANEYNCTVNLPLNLMPELMEEDRYDVKMQIFQFPVLVNHATTVHKLQGQTKESLYVTNYSYQRNWIYVALSRVQPNYGQCRQTFLRRRLDMSRNLYPHRLLLGMLRKFAQREPTPFDEDMIT